MCMRVRLNGLIIPLQLNQEIAPYTEIMRHCPRILPDSSSLELGLKLSTPIISAGSFGLTCDYTRNLQRLLPPARKVSGFFIQFWKHSNSIKPPWETVYVYKKRSNTDDCFWSVAKMTFSILTLHCLFIWLGQYKFINVPGKRIYIDMLGLAELLGFKAGITKKTYRQYTITNW